MSKKYILAVLLIGLFIASNSFAMMGSRSGLGNKGGMYIGSMTSGNMTGNDSLAGGGMSSTATNRGSMMSGNGMGMTTGGPDSRSTGTGGQMGDGMGHGTPGARRMIFGMIKNTLSHGYLDSLLPIGDVQDAREAFQIFIDSSNSELQVSELWEYDTAFKAELADINGNKAFDLLADKFTGAVTPEMGLSMMLNASYGKGLYRMTIGNRNLNLSSEEASALVQEFIDNNNLPYDISEVETYPGYYKFHMTDPNGAFGMDIMLNGYNGKIWMDTLLGAPVGKY